MGYEVEPKKQRQETFAQYKKRRLKELRRDFKVTLTEDEQARAGTLTTEVQVDQFCMGVLNNRWG
jgi:hypothetical protein